jgi:phosphatidylglycerol---prolipoprotein diacylglyceryl transferase
MHPRLLDFSVDLKGFDGFGLESYFTMVAVGFITAAILLRRWAKANRLDTRLIIDFVIWMAIFGVLGSKLQHVIADGHFMDYVHACTDPDLVDWKIDQRECRALKGIWDVEKGVCHPRESNCLAWLDITSGGFAFYGGFIGAALFAVYFIRRHRLPAGKLIDIGACLLMLGVSWGRMGCMLAGCCFGSRTDSWLGVVFPGGSPASRHHYDLGLIESYRLESMPVYFTQFYSSLAAALIAAFTYLYLLPRKRFDGQVFCVAAGLYALFRFMIEFIRSDERGGAFGLSSSQLIAIGFLVVIRLLWRRFERRAAHTIGVANRKASS